jgi:hypothetical protein
VKAHRIAWELVHGPIPAGLYILHHCDNPACCNAFDTAHHLFLGTKTDNNRDMVAKGRANSWGHKSHTTRWDRKGT